jgi:hypothetical protein
MTSEHADNKAKIGRCQAVVALKKNENKTKIRPTQLSLFEHKLSTPSIRDY